MKIATWNINGVRARIDTLKTWLEQARPDVVCCNLAGNQVTNLIKQYAEFGLPYPIVGFNLNTADAWAAGEGNLSGTWPTVWHHDIDGALNWAKRLPFDELLEDTTDYVTDFSSST